jgi:enoyl-[acyl-carrier protein] reductase I
VKGPGGALEGKKALVIGIANNQSIAYGCALAFRALGASVAMTYVNEKSQASTRRRWPITWASTRRSISPATSASRAARGRFRGHREDLGQLDIGLHSIAFAPREDLHGRVTDCSRDGFLMAMDVSCHSFIRMAKLAEPLMKDGGSLFTMSYYGAEKVVDRYNLMGPVKAALEASARYLAAELGPKGIRVHPISPGPIKTRAATGIDRFDELMEIAATRAPSHMLVSIEDVGMATAFLASDYAKLITGETMHIDGGYHVVG